MVHSLSDTVILPIAGIILTIVWARIISDRCLPWDASLKALGYDGMSSEEREAAIKEKYSGKNTTLDFLKMQGELMHSGVLEHVMGDEARTYCDIIGLQFDYAYKEGFNGYSLGRKGLAAFLLISDKLLHLIHQHMDGLPIKQEIGLKLIRAKIEWQYPNKCQGTSFDQTFNGTHIYGLKSQCFRY